MTFRLNADGAIADLDGGLSLMAIRISSAFAVHPGDWLRSEIVEPHGLSVTDAARHLGVTRQAMSNLLNARAGLSADMAIRFEKAFGLKADTLLRMQMACELAHAWANERAIRVERFKKAA
jgi:antitoxin HigA-1